MVASGTLQNTAHLLVNHATRVAWESLTSCLFLQKCKNLRDSCEINDLIHKDQVQEAAQRCLSPIIQLEGRWEQNSHGFLESTHHLGSLQGQ